jgi:hypothetical protein
LRLKTKGGPDTIPPSFFINCSDERCYLLSQFFTICFEHSIIPPVWLTAFITPLFKKGKPVDANNCRPIALTCTMCKLMESIIKDQLVQFLVVPQGSVLGPILFLIFISDIDTVCKGNATLKLFADDAKPYSSVDFDAHSISLQQSLDNLCAWADQWQLSINISKCSVLSIASKTHQVPRLYYINGISITSNSTTVDLAWSKFLC